MHGFKTDMLSERENAELGELCEIHCELNRTPTIAEANVSGKSLTIISLYMPCVFIKVSVGLKVTFRRLFFDLPNSRPSNPVRYNVIMCKW